MNLDELTEKAITSVNESNRIGRGVDGSVYAITKGVALKLYNCGYSYHGSNRKDAEHEYELGRELHAQGVHLPDYFGIFKPANPINYWGVFMERISGLTSDSILYFLIKREAERQHEKQRELIYKLGYAPSDTSFLHNVMFNIPKWKLYLYDLVQWKKIK